MDTNDAIDTPGDFAAELARVRGAFLNENNYQRGVFVLPSDVADEFEAALIAIEDDLVALETRVPDDPTPGERVGRRVSDALDRLTGWWTGR